MSKIIKNTTGSPIDIIDTGIEIAASSSYTIPPQDYSIWAASSSILGPVSSGDLVVNDGSVDLTPAQGIGLLYGFFVQKDFVPAIKNNDRLKVEVLNTGGAPIIQVSSNDQTSGYLEQKVVGTLNKIVATVDGEGSDEKLRFTIGSHVFDKTVDTAANITNTPAGNIAATNVQSALNELDTEKQSRSEKSQANGYASLDSSGKVPISELPDTVVGAVDYKGTWNANTNTPNLVSATPDKGDYYVVNVAGATSLGGITSWNIGDWAIYNGSVWEKVDNTDAVTSVHGRIGTVVSANGDYTASQVTNVPAGTIAATTVQAALNELDTEKVPTTRSVSAGTGLNGGGDLSANRTISMPNVGTAGTYGSSSVVPVFTTDAQGRVSAAAPVTVDKLYDHWHGTTQYNASQLRKYTNTGTTNANGRITFNLTQNGNVGGTALFTSLLSISASGADGSGNPIQAPIFFVETQTATQVIIRAVRGTSTGVLIGGTVVSMQYAGAGYTARIEITGVK